LSGHIGEHCHDAFEELDASCVAAVIDELHDLHRVHRGGSFLSRNRERKREELDRSLIAKKLLETERGRHIDRARRRMLSKTTSRVQVHVHVKVNAK
jgi:hypothetical protein